MSVPNETAVFRSTGYLEDRTAEFPARLLEAGLVFRRAIECFPADRRSRSFEASLGRLSGLVARGEGPPGSI